MVLTAFLTTKRRRSRRARPRRSIREPSKRSLVGSLLSRPISKIRIFRCVAFVSQCVASIGWSCRRRSRLSIPTSKSNSNPTPSYPLSQGVSFQQSLVRDGNFRGAKLVAASFFDADLTGACLATHSQSRSRELWRLEIQHLTTGPFPFLLSFLGADFTGANLAQCNFELSNLKNAILKDAIVTEAYISGATRLTGESGLSLNGPL